MKHPEQDLQRAVADYLQIILPDTVVWSAISHGATLGGTAKDRAIRGATLKRMGQRKGVADLFISWKTYATPPMFGMLWIELKSPKGQASNEQNDFAERVRLIGHDYVVCRSLNGVITALKQYGVPTREAKR